MELMPPARFCENGLEISFAYHLRKQAALQNHVDAAISKAINLANENPPSVVKEIFMRAHDLDIINY